MSFVKQNTTGIIITDGGEEPTVIYDSVRGVWKMYWSEYIPGVTQQTNLRECSDLSALPQTWTERGTIFTTSGRSCFFVSGNYIYGLISTWPTFQTQDLYRMALGDTDEDWTLITSGAIVLGAGGQWDDKEMGNTDIYLEDGTFYVFYEAMNTASSTWGMGLATGSSLSSLTKSGSNPIISGVGHSLGGPNVHKIGDTYYMFCHEAVNGGNLPTSISLLTSTNKINWTNQGVLLANPGGSESQYADPYVVEYLGKTYLYFGQRADQATLASMSLAISPQSLEQMYGTTYVAPLKKYNDGHYDSVSLKKWDGAEYTEVFIKDSNQ